MTGALVGRRPALAVANAALREATAGAGQLLLVSGEPGIGKSALLAELAREAVAHGALVLRGACWDGGGTPTYWPWTQVLRAACEAAPDRLRPQDLGAAGRLLALLPAPDRPPPAHAVDADPADARFHLLDAVGTVLARLAAVTPLVVALDDLQWADEPSLQLLDFVAHRLRSDPVLLVGAYRDAEAGPALRSVVAGGQQLPLVGLNTRHVRELMAEVAATHDLPPPPDAIVSHVLRRSGGNPFFARELTRLVVAQGTWGSSVAGVVPDTVRDTLDRRLARLSQPCAEMLAAAAVAGAELRDEVLTRVIHVDDDRPPLPDLLAEATAARVLVAGPDPAGRHRFSHDLYRETIEAGLAPGERARLHLVVGRALQALRAEGGEVHLAELAAHLLASGAEEAVPDAVRYSAGAAAEAMARLGYEDARAHYERALVAAERAGLAATERLDLLLRLADARYCAGDGDGARSDLERAAALARRTGDVAGLARAAVARHHLGARGGAEGAAHVQLLTEAAAALPDEPSALRLRVLTALVQSMRHHRATDDEAVVAAGWEAVAVARAVGDASALGFALLALHDAIWQPGSGMQRLAVLDEMRDVAAAAGEHDLFAQAHQLRAAALLESGDPAGRSELARYIELVTEREHARGRWEAATRRATLAAIAGRWSDANDLAGEALALGRALAVPDAMGVYGTLHGSMVLFGGTEDSGALPVDQLPESAPASYYVQPLQALALLGRDDQAAAEAALAGYSVDDVTPGYDLEPLALAAGAIAAAGSDVQRARAYERLVPFAGLHAVVGGCASYWGAIDHHLGRLAAALGWREKAVAHLESAASAYRRLEAHAWADQCELLLTQLRGDRGVPSFRFDGGSWELTFHGTAVHLPDAKGLRDLAVLLSAPGRPVHAMRLLGDDEPASSDAVLDDRARKAYRARLDELDAEIDEAGRWNDSARVERSVIEREALIDELRAATGLGGRDRRLGDRSERARKTVTARIRDTLRRLDVAHPDLAAHLRATVTTGTECCYSPGP